MPLISAFLLLVVLYGWLAWEHSTPWLFTDELELTQISRAIAETGHGARRGVPYGFQTLATYATAPAWLIDDTHTAYSVAKYLGVAAMTAVVFPVYGLARMLVAPRWALWAAVASAAIPSFAYSGMLLEEPWAYTWAALCFYLIVRALVLRRRGAVALAVVASLVAPLVRGELGMIPVVFLLAAGAVGWRSEWAVRRRRDWSGWDWAGAVVIVAGACVLASALISSKSFQYLVATRYYKDRMLEYGLWAGGALTVGLGVLPVVAGLASLARPRSVPRTRERTAFVSVLGASLVCFGLYTAVKATYLSAYFATRVEERNLIYLSPLLFVGTALWLDRPRIRAWALAAAVGFVAYLAVSTPFQLDAYPYSDAFGLTILQVFNRNLALDDAGATGLLIGMLLVSAALLLAPRVLRARRRRAIDGVLAGTAVLTLAWCVAGAVSAGRASNEYADSFRQTLPQDLSWVDSMTGGEPAIFLGQGIDDQNGVHELEFWNRSLKHFWSLDGTAPPPGPILTPDLGKASGELSPDPGVRWVVTQPGIDLVGTIVAQAPSFDLVRLDGPLRLQHAQTGFYGDGWAKGFSAYSQFATPGVKRGYAVVLVSRAGWTGPNKPGRVTIRVGTLVVGKDRQPAFGRVTAVRHWTVGSGLQKTFVIPAPPAPFRIETRITPTFSPAEFGASSDQRQLGAQISYGFSASATPSR